MRIDYSPVDARARGLARHLCSREELERWASLPDPPALGRAIEARGSLVTPLPAAADAADIEEALRRAVAHYLALLVRWAGPANPVLDAFHAVQERRSLRALVRGAAEGAPAEMRLAGLLPTPRLPVPALAELAQARTPREIAMRLLVFGDPHAEALVALTGQARTDCLEMELAFARILADRLRRAAGRGDAALRESVRARIDLVNAQAALELAGSASDFAAASLFVAGGQALDRDAFVAAVGAGSRNVAAGMLAQVFAGTALAKLFAPPVDEPGQLEVKALQHAIATLRHRGRIEPLGSAPVQLFLAQLDAQSKDIRRLAWGLELGMPPTALRAGLLTPWT